MICEAERQRASLLPGQADYKARRHSCPPAGHMFLPQHARPHAFGRGKGGIPASHFTPSSSSGQAKSASLRGIFASLREEDISMEGQSASVKKPDRVLPVL